MSHKLASLKGPGASDISHGVAATAENESWQAELLHKIDAVCMTAHAEIEAAQSIAGQTVATTLEYYSLWLVVFHNSANDGLENVPVGRICNAIAEGKVDRMVLAITHTNVAKLASTREILAVLVERASHDTVGGVERFLDTVTVMDVNIDVKNTLVESQELNDSEYNVCTSRLATDFSQ